MELEDQTPEASPDEDSRASDESFARRVWNEVRQRPYAYGVMVVFALIGGFFSRVFFPEVSPAAGAVGGLALGVYAALTAVPNKFLE